ncbi:MAG: hypothetical protein WA234_03285, partial [Rectinemataceae bacterium]
MKTTALLLALLLLAGAGVAAQDAVTSPSQETHTSFLDFPGKLNYHMVAGWTSTGLLFTAGALGAARALDLMNRGHDIRESMVFDEDNSAAIAAQLGP